MAPRILAKDDAMRSTALEMFAIVTENVRNIRTAVKTTTSTAEQLMQTIMKAAPYLLELMGARPLEASCRFVASCPSAQRLASLTEGFSRHDDVISNEELQKTSEQLYQGDYNRAEESDIILNKQHLASNTRDHEDQSPKPLFSYVNQEKLFSKPTYVSFIKLLDNYHKRVGTEEDFTAEQLAEQDTFLEEVMKTEVMKDLYRFLHSKHRYSTEPEFVADLKKMWFGLYSRGNDEGDSSGFEHVFIGEVKKGKVSGFHNWIRFYLLEKQGVINYLSYNYDGPWTSYPDVLGMQFNWDGFYKEVGTSFIGSSPEFEFGLYSLCFIARPGKLCRLKIGGHDLGIQTYTWDKSSYDNGKKYIATAYVVSP
ncbi:Poly(U)-specific endoribonuclease [Varanus komodoensis]|nr:Poly(U)-specific endoribonuclease [Varanus komodoensis]